jgi:transcriptional regulator with XRE-family HTH domain
MSHWIGSTNCPVDFEVLEESALAMAQSTIQNAITNSGISRVEVARRMECHRSYVSRILNGSHNLTIKTMAKALAACGDEVRFERVPIEWNWVSVPQEPEEVVPACAGTTILIAESLI